jgi:hypothetical protein
MFPQRSPAVRRATEFISQNAESMIVNIATKVTTIEANFQWNIIRSYEVLEQTLFSAIPLTLIFVSLWLWGQCTVTWYSISYWLSHWAILLGDGDRSVMEIF